MNSKHTDWNINISFIIHVDFDCAWAEYYPITLNDRTNVINCVRAYTRKGVCFYVSMIVEWKRNNLYWLLLYGAVIVHVPLSLWPNLAIHEQEYHYSELTRY